MGPFWTGGADVTVSCISRAGTFLSGIVGRDTSVADASGTDTVDSWAGDADGAVCISGEVDCPLLTGTGSNSGLPNSNLPESASGDGKARWDGTASLAPRATPSPTSPTVSVIACLTARFLPTISPTPLTVPIPPSTILPITTEIPAAWRTALGANSSPCIF